MLRESSKTSVPTHQPLAAAPKCCRTSRIVSCPIRGNADFMAQDHTLMASRFELKYLIPERIALQVRAFVQQHLEVDEFGVGKSDFSYPVHSLYLDSDDWEIHRRTRSEEHTSELQSRFGISY